MTNRPRKFSGFGVVTRQGQYLQQYFSPTEAQTREAYEAHNPQIEGHEDGYKVLPIRFLLTE